MFPVLAGQLGPIRLTLSELFAYVVSNTLKRLRRHRAKISSMLSDLQDMASEVLPVNEKRVKYFCAIKKQLDLIDMYGDMLGYFGESESDGGPYESLEQLRVIWRNQELRHIRANLEKTQYRLRGIESVAVVLDGRRIEHVS